MQVNPVNNYGIVDDSQLINSYNQVNLTNFNPNYSNQISTLDQYQIPMQNLGQQFAGMGFGENNSQQSLENNMGMSDGPISSLPLYMRKMRPIRSQSINRDSKESGYMNNNFLFEKVQDHHSKDDIGIQKDVQPIKMENFDANQFMPKVIKYENDALSSVGGSSQSSIMSFNDGGSVSSLELSFDGSGIPFLRNNKQSAFSRVKSNMSEHSGEENNEGNNTYDNKADQLMVEVNDSSHDSRKHNKSSFFRLKNETQKSDGRDDT